MITVSRYHDFCCGHRVVGHEGKCKQLHGHEYRIHFECAAPDLDQVGRVIDFSIIKECLCNWLEDQWDHKFLLWQQDPILNTVFRDVPSVALLGIELVPFNPTAENIGYYLLHTICPSLLGHGLVKVVSITVEETKKCSAKVTLDERL